MGSNLFFDVQTTQAESGFQPIPEGWYLFEMQDATDVRAEKKSDFQRRSYKSKILAGPMGPQASRTNEYVGRTFFDRMRESDDWKGRHMELIAACMGSVENVRNAARSRGGNFDITWIHGCKYLGLVTLKEGYNNVAIRVPFTQNNMNAIQAGQDPVDVVTESARPNGPAPQQGGMPTPGGSLQPSPLGYPPGVQAPMQQQFQAPTQQFQPPMQQPQQFQAQPFQGAPQGAPMQSYPAQGMQQGMPQQQFQAPPQGAPMGYPGGMPASQAPQGAPAGLPPGPPLPPSPVPGQ